LATVDWPVIVDGLAAGGTIGALLLAVWQLRQNARLASDAAALQTWMEYLRLGLDNPDLGETRIALSRFKMKSVQALLSGNTMGSQRYLWFLTILLDACDNLVRQFSTRRWHQTVEYNLGLHRPALMACWSDVGPYYSDALGALVARVLDDSSDVADRGL
jgi:hypothetical protein